MPVKTQKFAYVKISPAAYAHLEKLSDKYKAMGFTEKSMKAIASAAILCLPVPNGSTPSMNVPCKEEEK